MRRQVAVLALLGLIQGKSQVSDSKTWINIPIFLEASLANPENPFAGQSVKVYNFQSHSTIYGC